MWSDLWPGTEQVYEPKMQVAVKQREVERHRAYTSVIKRAGSRITHRPETWNAMWRVAVQAKKSKMSCLPKSVGGRRRTGGAEGTRRRASEGQGKKCEAIMAVRRSLDRLVFATFPSRERRTLRNVSWSVASGSFEFQTPRYRHTQKKGKHLLMWHQRIDRPWFRRLRQPSVSVSKLKGGRAKLSPVGSFTSKAQIEWTDAKDWVFDGPLDGN